ncbi:DUF4129 domain-containing protein [bacterium]|nr:DUF4129 domain-containing protein [bacterium]
MKRRQTKQFTKLDELPTAADYIAEGLAPLLIMVMVEALVWFAQDLVYRGEHEMRLRWTLFWFVLGMVGISRIAIEKTTAYAGLYALALGGAVALMINQFVPMPLAGWLLLGLIWWCTNKLVWDCTLIDDKEDASGEGLLEIVGIDETTGEEPPVDVGVQTIETGSNKQKKKYAWWRRLFINESSRAGQPHAHGLWIIYFLLAALPMFGFGQMWLVRVHPERTGLTTVAIFLLAAMSLLLLTSFLGLRRYLRQRRLKMPVRIAGTWIGVGTMIIVGALMLSFVVPRPLALVASSESAAVLNGRKLEEKNVENDASSDRESERAKSGGTEKQSSSNEIEGNQNDDASKRKLNGGKAENATRPEDGQSADSKSPSVSLPQAPSWLRWVVWAIFGCVLLYMIIRNWRQIWLAIGQLIESLRALFRPNVKMPKRPGTRRGPVLEPSPPVRFVDLANPFRSGENVDPATAVCRTFKALEVWSTEHGCARSADTTSTEFAESLMAIHPGLRRSLRHLARIYAGLLYADRLPKENELPALAALWDELERSPAIAANR